MTMCHRSFASLLYREEQQDVEHYRKRRASTACPPISITNVLPSQPPTSCTTEPTTVDLVARKPAARLQVPEPLDDAVKRYTAWQCSRFRSTAIQMQYRRAGELALSECLDLELVFEEKDIEFFVKNGVQARRCISIYS